MDSVIQIVPASGGEVVNTKKIRLMESILFQRKLASVVAAVFIIVVANLIFPAQASAYALRAPTYPGTDWIVMDVATGRILAENSAHDLRYPASLTKLMTLDLTFQALNAGRLTFDTPIPVSATAARVQPMKLNLLPGQTITVRQAILGMMTLSANDAATALGEYLGNGSINRFAQAMTAHARELGMLHTSFRNPSGLPDPGQVVDASDVAILARHLLLTYPQYRYMFAVPGFDFEGRTIRNLDGMLGRYPGVIGMKTGFTDAARFNLVTAAVHDGRLLVGVELHAQSWDAAYATMAKLLDAGFASDTRRVNLLAANRDASPVVNVATVNSNSIQRDPVAMQGRHPATNHRLVARSPIGNEKSTGWTAQIGPYDTYALAQHKAIPLRAKLHFKTARVVRVVRHHRRVWEVQLTGLTDSGAREICSRPTHRDKTCTTAGPHREVLAAR